MPFSKKQYIAQTFLSLCHTKPMGKVTIQEMPTTAGSPAAPSTTISPISRPS